MAKRKLSYRKLYDIACLVREEQERLGWRFRKGVERTAALLAAKQISGEAVLTSMTEVFRSHRVN